MGMSPRLMRPRASGFTPKSISGLLLWLDATDSSTITIGTGVSSWGDKSGASRNITQGTGNNQPALVTSGINGKAAVQFDGSNDTLSVASFPALTGMTIFAVCKRNWSTGTGTYRAMAGMNYGQLTGLGYGLFTGNAGLDWGVSEIVQFGNGYGISRAPRAIGPPGLTDGAAAVLTASLGSADSGSWINGTSIATKVRSDGAVSIASTTLFVGGANATTDVTDAYIGEFIFYSRTLSVTERQTVERALGKKWGITVA